MQHSLRPDNYFKRAGQHSRPSSLSSGYSAAIKQPAQVQLPPEHVMSAVPREQVISELSVEEDCQRYHWDCSDWVNQTHTAHTTGDHNTWGDTDTLDPGQDIQTLPEDDNNDNKNNDDDARSLASSEGESQLGAVYPDTTSPMMSPMHQTNKSIEELLMANDMNYADDDNGSADIPNIYDYKLHLNNYLPTYHLGSDPETTDEATPMLGRHQKPVFSASPEAVQRQPRQDHNAAVRTHEVTSQDPEASARKPSSAPLRGLVITPPVVTGQMSPVLTSNGHSSDDKLCEIEDEDDVEEEANKTRLPNSRVTRV